MDNGLFKKKKKIVELVLQKESIPVFSYLMFNINIFNSIPFAGILLEIFQVSTIKGKERLQEYNFERRIFCSFASCDSV